MQILVAPDKFKGSLNAREVGENIASGLRDVLPDAIIETMPVADGGEGTADAISHACAGEKVTCAAHDALGREIAADYFWLADRSTAVMEMSAAAGLWRIAPQERDLLRADTFGIGEMIREVLGRGAKEILIGLGGSATNDGGFGMAQALGFRFLANEHEVETPAELVNLARIKAPTQSMSATIVAAVDVRNRLLGPRGATRTFGPQKGATPDQIEILECALTKLADTVTRDLGCDFRNNPGAGAAGGLGFGLMRFCSADLRPGFDVVAVAVGLEEKIKNADVVITGEGKLDAQTLEGKAPAGVARLARRSGKPVFAVVGRAEADRPPRDIFDGVYELGGNIPQARELLREQARELAKALKR